MILLIFFYLYCLNFHCTECLTIEEVQLVQNLTLNRVIDGVAKQAAKPEDILFFVSTRQNNHQLIDSNMNIGVFKGKPMKIIIHGFHSSSDEQWVKNMTEAFLRNNNINVVNVDWSKIAGLPAIEFEKVVGYMFSVANFISKKVWQLRKFMQIPFSDIHLVGHSLGAHLSGMVGWQFKKHYGEEIGRITGLDPAQPLFLKASKMYKLDIYDARFVDVIHTDSGKFGLEERCGTTDFFPQGGISPQPPCEVNKTEIAFGCSHSMAHEYFTESINSLKFKAKRCQSYKNYLKGLCEKGEISMGEHVSLMADRGKYYLNVNKNQPYARNGRL